MKDEFSQAGPLTGPIAANIYCQSQHGCPRQCIRYEWYDNRGDTAELSDQPRSGVISPCKLCFMNPCSLNLERRNEPEGNKKHERIINWNFQAFHCMHDIPRLGWYDKELKGTDKDHEPEGKDQPKLNSTGCHRQTSANNWEPVGNQVAQDFTARHCDNGNSDKDHAHDHDETELVQHFGTKVCIRGDYEYRKHQQCKKSKVC